jgi:hypothetical protein
MNMTTTLESPVAPAACDLPRLTSSGRELDPAYLARLRDSTDLLSDVDALRRRMDVEDLDSFCENKHNARAWGKSWGTGGTFLGDPNQIRRGLGGRWLTTDYRAGDVLIFSIFTVHASLDNRTNRIRLSSDSRYQPASAPADERWVGENPIRPWGGGEAGESVLRYPR